MNYIAQGIGLIGMILLFVSFQNNNKKRLLLIQVFACIMFAMHFTLLGAYTGAGMNAAEVARNIVFSQDEKLKYKKAWIVVFMMLFTVIGVISWQNSFSILPIIATNLSVIAFSMRTPRYIRLCYLPVSVFWLIYNISVFSVAGIITEIFCLTSIFIAFWRYGVKGDKGVGQAAVEYINK